ncbi:MAG TPA: DNA double-strand break repair nuclease NurA [Chloroflexota bacterium]|jgi:hypothetical protein|nr:DNA double-strand break repair nuclease NurA [Chloroflexota bacterium]
MPLLAPVIKAARARAEEMKRVLGTAEVARWRSLLAPRWLPLPEVPRGAGRRPAAGRDVHVAVDGTGHMVQLSYGAHFILAVAAAGGPDWARQRERADMEILPARYDDGQAASARDLLMRSLEAFVATDVAGAVVDRGLARSAVLWIDGSLYADLSHMAGAPGQVRWGSGVERAGTLLRTTAALLDLAERHQLWLIGIGKTQQAGFLYDALTAPALTELAAAPGGRRPLARPLAEPLGEPGAERPSDGELLAAAPTGWSWPLLLDGTRFPHLGPDAAEALKDCPAIVSCYVRPHPADLPLRVDIPASAVGLDQRLLPDLLGQAPTPWPAWVPDPAAVLPVIEVALSAYGGVHAYNAPLYAVDRRVRLSRRDLETRFLPICARVAGIPPAALAVNRGRRRFL